MNREEPHKTTEQDESASDQKHSNILRRSLSTFQRLFKRTKINGNEGRRNVENEEQIECDVCEESHAADTSAVAIQQTADILKLDIDCFGEIFDYLSLADLISIGQTCKRLQQVAGFYFLQNFAGSITHCKDGFICIDNKFRADHFAMFIRKILSSYTLDVIVDRQNQFRRLKQITLEHGRINAEDMDGMKTIGMQVESLRLIWCAIAYNYDFHKTFLKYFPNLKCLSIANISSHLPVIIGTDNSWLRQKYATLEHLELLLYGQPIIPEMRKFLELNPNIKTFFTMAKCFLANDKSMLKSNVQLNELALYITHDNWLDFEKFCDLLDKLYDRGFYKRLRLQYSPVDTKQECIDRLASLNALVQLFINVKSGVHLSDFSNLEELLIDASDQITDLETMADILTKLEVIRFRFSNLKHISILTNRAVKLKKIIVGTLLDDNHDMREWMELSYEQLQSQKPNIVIDLKTLNDEREKMPEARRISLYVEENVYLATKWSVHETNLDLIRLMRKESYERANKFNIYG